MEIIQHTAKTKASVETIWSIWTAVDQWKNWDHRIESSQIFGHFEEGTLGEIKPKGGPLLKIKLTQVNPKKSFVLESKVMGAKVIFSHQIEEKEEESFLTLSIKIEGPLASLLANTLGSQIKKNVPEAIHSLIKRVEEKVQA